jgi:hypothetical protein
VEVVLFGCVAVHVCVCTAAHTYKYKEHAAGRPPAARRCRRAGRARVERSPARARRDARSRRYPSCRPPLGAAPRGAHGAARLPRCRSHDADVATASGSAEARPRGQVTGGAASQNPFGRCGRHGPLVLVMSALGTAQGVLTAARMLLRAHSATAPLAALDVVVGFFSLSLFIYLSIDRETCEKSLAPMTQSRARLLALVLLVLGLLLAWWKKRRNLPRLLQAPARPRAPKRQQPTVQTTEHEDTSGFAAFLSHYKTEAATEARWLKAELEAVLGKRCFLDSDDLSDLSRLKGHVRESSVLLLLQTRSGTQGAAQTPWPSRLCNRPSPAPRSSSPIRFAPHPEIAASQSSRGLGASSSCSRRLSRGCQSWACRSNQGRRRTTLRWR